MVADHPKGERYKKEFLWRELLNRFAEFAGVMQRNYILKEEDVKAINVRLILANSEKVLCLRKHLNMECN